MFSDKKNSFGFTLIELMVVFVIMVALIILVLSGYSEARPRLALERTAEGFISNISLARENSMNSLAYMENEEAFVADYGISLKKNSNEYIIFIDKNTNKIYDSGDGVEKISLEKEAEITSDNLDVFFFSKDSSVYFNGATGEEVSVVFSSKKDANIKTTVKINSSGFAEVVYE